MFTMYPRVEKANKPAGSRWWILLLLLTVAGRVGATPQKLLLDVQTAPLAWADSRLPEKLETEFSRNADLRVCPSGRLDPELPSFPGNRTDIDSLLNWGLEVGGRYLLVVTVTDESLERRKSFSLPLIFHKWETVGTLTGEYRLLDLQKGRLLSAEPFCIELVGSRQFQFSTDDDRNDPNLHLTAPYKRKFFSHLEDKLVAYLVERVQLRYRGR